MRTSIITATLLSLGVLSGAPTAHADPASQTLFDTLTGSTTGPMGEVCSKPIEFHYINDQSQSVNEYNPQSGYGILFHAEQTITITGIRAFFKVTANSDVSKGVGAFVIWDVATQKQVLRAPTDWISGEVIPGSLLGLAGTLDAGKDYLISYVFSADPTIGGYACVEFPGVAIPASGVLTALGYEPVVGDDAASTAVHEPAWKPVGALSQTAIPPFAIDGFVVDTDTDTDEDGVTDDVDNCVDEVNEGQADWDYDDVGDACDNCPYSYNPDQSSCSNGGGGGGATNPDADGDGIFDVRDNCPIVANAGQGDSDHDGTGDACDSPADDTGCNAGGGSPSLLVGFGMLLASRRRRARTSK